MVAKSSFLFAQTTLDIDTRETIVETKREAGAQENSKSYQFGILVNHLSEQNEINSSTKHVNTWN